MLARASGKEPRGRQYHDKVVMLRRMEVVILCISVLQAMVKVGEVVCAAVSQALASTPSAWANQSSRRVE